MRLGEFAEYAAARPSHLKRPAYVLYGDWHEAQDRTQAALLNLYSIHRDPPPASLTAAGQLALTRDGLLGVLKRPAFADLVKVFFTEGLGHTDFEK